jgi:hypothetical protein
MGQIAQIYDISGELVTCEPRCTAADATSGGWRPCVGPPTARSGIENCCHPVPRPETVYIGLGPFPEDKYRLATTEGPSSDWFVYTLAAPQPLGFIDLLFSNPTGQEEPRGVYPVVNPGSGVHSEIKPVEYEVRFPARRTTWTYYIVPQSPRIQLSDLVIRDESPVPVVFGGPDEVRLPNGARAYRFVSERPISLLQHPEILLSLRGRRADVMAEDAVLVRRLPVASSEQVLPGPPSPGPESTHSSIYVYV